MNAAGLGGSLNVVSLSAVVFPSRQIPTTIGSEFIRAGNFRAPILIE